MTSPTAHVTDAALAADLAVAAGKLLRTVRADVGFAHPAALGDAGDFHANELLVGRLRAERPGDAILSEEAHDDLARLQADRVWIIDPLDGTREYSTEGRNDWAVHVALWQRSPDGRHGITDAAVSLPAYDDLVFRTDTVTADQVPSGIPDVVRVATSASRPPAILHWMRQSVEIERVPLGSAGIKAMAVVSGQVDAYIHAGGQWEWDSAAPAGVVLAAGLHASRLDGSPLEYNQPNAYLPDLLMCRTELAPILLEAIRRAWQ